MREQLKKATRYYELKALYQKYERALIPSMLVIGVLADFITFRAISIRNAFILLAIHLVLSGSIIAYVNYYDSKRIETKSNFYRYLRLASPLIIQFTFGALLSASLIFYWFSGVLSVSWPFMILITILIVSNDVFRDYYQRPLVQIGVYFFIVFSIFSLIIPFLFNSISAWIFILSGVTSLLVIFIYMQVLSKHLVHIRSQRKKLSYVVAIIYLFMNGLYFLNIIPPIPLSLREAGVYHDLNRVPEGYEVLAEGESILQKLVPGQIIHTQSGLPVYVFTSIFAPADLDTTIVHHWQFYNESERKWVSKDKLSFFISGGNDGGYRGYSVKSTITEGRWRIDVETKRGQVLGRIPLRVKFVEELPALKTETK